MTPDEGPQVEGDRSGVRAQRPRPASRALLVLIAGYRAVSAGRAPRCRFVPSCSEYAAQAVHEHGAFRALPLMARRLGRCRPGGGFGYDPVPTRAIGSPALRRGDQP